MESYETSVDFCYLKDSFLYWDEKNLVGYRVVSSTNAADFSLIYKSIRDVSSKFDWFPNLLPPLKVDETENFQIALECSKVNVSGKKDWMWEKIEVICPTKKRKKKENLYGSLALKKLLWFLFRTVAEFLGSNARPIIKFYNVLLSKTGCPVIVEFEKRDHQKHDENFEVDELILVFEYIRKSRGGIGETVRAEMLSLKKWLKKSKLQGNPEEFLENVFFWDTDIRVSYICRLHDWVEGGNSLTGGGGNAFHSTEMPTKNWLEVLEGSGDPVLYDFLFAGNDHYNINKFGDSIQVI